MSQQMQSDDYQPLGDNALPLGEDFESAVRSEIQAIFPFLEPSTEHSEASSHTSSSISSDDYGSASTLIDDDGQPIYDGELNAPRSSSSRDDACSESGRESLMETTTPVTRAIRWPESTWTPYTLQNWFLFLLSFLAFSLGLVTVLLLLRSKTSYGVGGDDGSVALLFGWRFTPTLIAIFYVQLTTMLLSDVKRTEPFACLARKDGAIASSSILQSIGPWWTALRDGFSKVKNGRRSRSWTLIAAAVVNILGFLAISPLSSAILTSGDIAVPRTAKFQHQTLQANTTLALDVDRIVRFRAIANLIQNASSSPWITDKYTILPVLPLAWPDTPSNIPAPEAASQKWGVDTLAFKSDLVCTAMKPDSVQSSRSISVLLSSGDGCQYGLNLASYTDIYKNGGVGWFHVSTDMLSNTDQSDDSPASVQSNRTAGCGNRELIVILQPVQSEETKIKAYLCQNQYWMANVTATVDVSDEKLNPWLGEEELTQQWTRLSDRDPVLNTTDLEALMVDENWQSYMLPLRWTTNTVFTGLGVLLGAAYQYELSDMWDAPDIIYQAGRVKQRLLGEALISALS
jgi:hypothetical protein